MEINNEATPIISIILPCRNEEESIGECIIDIKNVLNQHKIHGEIIVSDSSSDKSPEIAASLEARIIKHDMIGYGRAYLEGFKIASGKYLFLADADGTYNFSEIPKFLDFLISGHDMVIGNRLKGHIQAGAMPWLHRFVGTPFLSSIFHILYGNKIGDINCGMRAISRQSLDSLELKTTGMEFASEMIVKAVRKKLNIKELPIDYHKRKGESKLKTIPDGCRHLCFLLQSAINRTE